MPIGTRSDGFIAFPDNPVNTVGKKILSVPFQTTIATGADPLLPFILSGPHSFDSKINAIHGATPALTSANDCDLGFFKLDADGLFVAIDSDILWDGVDLSSALSFRELLGTLNASLNRDQNIGKLLGLSSESAPVGGVYLGLLLNTASTAASEDLKLVISVEEANTQ